MGVRHVCVNETNSAAICCSKRSETHTHAHFLVAIIYCSLVFMHPGDFTPVCTTELGEAAKRSNDFAKRGVKMVGFSCNDADSHKLWIQDIEVVTGGKVKLPSVLRPRS